MKINEIVRPLNLAEDLIRRFGGRPVKFKDLPATAKKAILTRAREHLDPSELPKINPNMRFGYVEIPMAILQQAVFQNLQREQPGFKSFDEYHQWYVSHNDTPHHTEVWPVELETEIPDEMGLIHDGSHRFHSYVRGGVQVVPAIYQI